MSELPVKVAVHVRPLMDFELAQNCGSCVVVDGNNESVAFDGGVHDKRFTFDHVFQAGNGDDDDGYTSMDLLYENCVEPLVQTCFEGRNATVLAYGQTGSGKTFTMGTTPANMQGVIPRVAREMFRRLEGGGIKGEVKVSFFEIYCSDVYDLLASSKKKLSIRQDGNNQVFVENLTERKVASCAELFDILEHGTQNRVTGQTNMNETSSRSHAIFTIELTTTENDTLVKKSKFRLVDLAGSERAKRTGAEGDRMTEGININQGLLALGNVISALGDESKRHEISHIPYRASKLTRILQDSLGGNSVTCMIACISPADSNLKETLNTLVYANRARNIKNKPVVNNETLNGHDAKLLAFYKTKVAELEQEIDRLKGTSCGRPTIQIKEMNHAYMKLAEKNCMLESMIEKLKENDQVRDLIDTQHQKWCEDDAAVTKQNGKEEEEEDEEKRDHEVGEEDQEFVKKRVHLESELETIDAQLAHKQDTVNKMERMRIAFEEALDDICQQLRIVQTERDDVVAKLQDKENQGGGWGKGEMQNQVLRQKLADLEKRNESLRKQKLEQEKQLKKQQRMAQTLAIDRMKNDIVSLKQSRVKLLHDIKKHQNDYNQLKKEHVHKMKQAQQKERKQQVQIVKLARKQELQARVLKRKTEEAAMAQKRLRDLLKKQTNNSKGGGPATAGSSSAEVKQVESWLEEQAQMAHNIMKARQALDSEMEKRKILPAGDPQIALCTEKIKELQGLLLLDNQQKHRWTNIRTTSQAKLYLKTTFAKLVKSLSQLEKSNIELQALQEEQDELEDMIDELKREQIVGQANTEREMEEKMLAFFMDEQQDLEAGYQAQLRQLNEENRRLLEQLQSQKSIPKKNKKKKQPKQDQNDEDYDDEDFWFSSELDEDGEEDDDDDEWFEDDESPVIRASRKKNSTSIGVAEVSGNASTGLVVSKRENDPSPNSKLLEENNEVNEEELIEKLNNPALVERIQQFTVESLKDALSFLGLVCSRGRKVELRQRLMKGLVEKGIQSLPEPIPKRNGKKTCDKEPPVVYVDVNNDEIKPPKTVVGDKSKETREPTLEAKNRPINDENRQQHRLNEWKSKQNSSMEQKLQAWKQKQQQQRKPFGVNINNK